MEIDNSNFIQIWLNFIKQLIPACSITTCDNNNLQVNSPPVVCKSIYFRKSYIYLTLLNFV